MLCVVTFIILFGQAKPSERGEHYHSDRSRRARVRHRKQPFRDDQYPSSSNHPRRPPRYLRLCMDQARRQPRQDDNRILRILVSLHRSSIASTLGMQYPHPSSSLVTPCDFSLFYNKAMVRSRQSRQAAQPRSFQGHAVQFRLLPNQREGRHLGHRQLGRFHRAARRAGLERRRGGGPVLLVGRPRGATGLRRAPVRVGADIAGAFRRRGGVPFDWRVDAEQPLPGIGRESDIASRFR